MVKGKIVPFNNGFRIHVRYISFIPLHYVYLSLVKNTLKGKKLEKLKSLKNNPYSNGDFFFKNN